MLVYRLSYRGLYLGHYQITARRLPDGGWHLHGALTRFSPARILGFDLEMDSRTTPELYTRRFEKRIQSPIEGVIQLVARVDRRVEATRYQNGKPVGRYAARLTRVRDDLSLVYHIRVRPVAQNVAFLGLYGIVRGPLRLETRRTLRVPAGTFETRTFRFQRPEAFFEMDLSEPGRLPVRIVFGYGSERIVASLANRP